MQSPSKLIMMLICFLLTAQLFAQGTGSPNVPLLANFNPYPSVGYSDVWGYTAPDGREYALLGARNGLSIVDITDTGNVQEVAFIASPNSSWKDYKTYQNYAYACTEANDVVQIIDLSNLPNGASVVNTWSTGATNPHNVYVDEEAGILYVIEDFNFGSSVKALSLADPANPTFITAFAQDCHDVATQSGRLYVAGGSNPVIDLFDVTNINSPQLIASVPIPAAGYVHNVWSTADNNYMMTTEETGGKTIKYWDISDPNSPSIVSEVLGPDGLAHNAFIKGEYAYVSHYGDGLRIYDLSDPNNVFEAGFYDTWAPPSGTFDGAWGAYPYLASGKVLISDQVTGLYVVFFQGAVDADALDPKSPTTLTAYSDFNAPTEMQLSWTDPVELVDGTPLPFGDFIVEIERDGNMIASVNGGIQTYTDMGLNDGQSYEYKINTRITSNDSTSLQVGASWIAGGAAEPNAPEVVGLDGDANQVTVSWRNSSTNIDGTPMDDLAEVKLYQDGIEVATFAQASADTGTVVTETYTPATPGQYEYYVTSVDNESPANESVPSNTAFTPLSAPFVDNFATAGAPNADRWITDNVQVNNNASGEISAPFSMNLNGNPDGIDVVDSRPINLAGLENNQVTMSYWYQPAGTGNDPEVQDSLQLFFKNSDNNWVIINEYPGRPFQAFQQVTIDFASLPADRGNMFHSQFQMRFRSLGSQSATQLFDNWFVDDVNLDLGIPLGIGDDELTTITEFKLEANYPNPFNPTTTISYQIPRSSDVKLTIYNTLGQKVRTLVNENRAAGAYDIQWNGRNDAGVQVGSGLYFYSIEADGFTQTRKMMLLK